MGHKIKPNSYRLGVIKDWSSRWFPKKIDYRQYLEEDVLIRKIILEKIGAAGIDRIVIERSINSFKIFIKAAKPGLIIGRGGKGVEELIALLKKEIAVLRRVKKIETKIDLSLNIEELKHFDVSANVIAYNIAKDFERRMPFRRTIKKYLEQILQNKEVKGGRIMVSGRLDGAEIARTEHLSKGKIPLQTLRADIDYGEATAFTTYGTIGIKIWINKGEVFSGKERPEDRKEGREKF